MGTQEHGKQPGSNRQGTIDPPPRTGIFGFAALLELLDRTDDIAFHRDRIGCGIVDEELECRFEGILWHLNSFTVFRWKRDEFTVRNCEVVVAGPALDDFPAFVVELGRFERAETVANEFDVALAVSTQDTRLRGLNTLLEAVPWTPTVGTSMNFSVHG